MLQSIAEVGGGNYAFIPDSGMVGTVFVHAVANLQATFAINATLEITYKTPLKIEEAMGNAVHSVLPTRVGDTSRLSMQLGILRYGQSRDIVLNMPGLAAQVKDGVLDSSTWFIDASLGFEAIIDGNGSRSMAGARRNVTLASGLPEEELAYHLSRAQLCAFLSNLFPMRQDMEHVCDPDVATGHLMRQKFQHLLDTIPARKYIDQRNRSLMDDLKGANPHGQISMVIHDCNFFVRWGQHYLPSLQNAHTRQYCSSFKDPGPLQYGTDSPLFIACRDRLEETFDKLPPPIPSLVGASIQPQPQPHAHGARMMQSISNHSRRTAVSQLGTSSMGARACQMMSHMHRVADAGGIVKPGDPNSEQRARQLQIQQMYLQMQLQRQGQLQGQAASQQVPCQQIPRPPVQQRPANIIRNDPEQQQSQTAPDQISMARYQSRTGVCFAAETLVTLASGDTIQIQYLKSGMAIQTLKGPRIVVALLLTLAEQEPLRRLENVLVTAWHPVSEDGVLWQFPAHLTDDVVSYTGYICSVLLEPHQDADAHVLSLGSYWGTTLGHGVTKGDDVRAHNFFGCYKSVRSGLDGLSAETPLNGVYRGHGVVRDSVSGRVVGFRPYKAFYRIRGPGEDEQAGL